MSSEVVNQGVKTNDLAKTLETWAVRGLLVCGGLLYTDMREDYKQLEQRMFVMQQERFTQQDANNMEARITKMVEGALGDVRNTVGTLRADINDKFDTILTIIDKRGSSKNRE